MDDIADTDLSLFGLWPGGPGGPGAPGGAGTGRNARAETREKPGTGWSDQRRMRAAGRFMLEVKSAEALSPVEQLSALLNDLTLEMREQFELFRKLRGAAQALISGEDEAASRLARSDAKAATDAMALMVRTLEKIDSLQRQLARDREEAALAGGDGESDEEIRDEIRRIIEAQAQARARVLMEVWLAGRDGVGTTGRDEEPERTPGGNSG
ncbi:MAG: hypothetical protein WC048_12140 [Rhizobium sp.]